MPLEYDGKISMYLKMKEQETRLNIPDVHHLITLLTEQHHHHSKAITYFQRGA
jgi:hypothetical protein